MDKMTLTTSSYCEGFEGAIIKIHKPFRTRIKELLTRPRVAVIVGFNGSNELKIEHRRISWQEWRAEAQSILIDLIDDQLDKYENEVWGRHI